MNQYIAVNSYIPYIITVLALIAAVGWIIEILRFESLRKKTDSKLADVYLWTWADHRKPNAADDKYYIVFTKEGPVAMTYEDKRDMKARASRLPGIRTLERRLLIDLTK